MKGRQSLLYFNFIYNVFTIIIIIIYFFFFVFLE